MKFSEIKEKTKTAVSKIGKKTVIASMAVLIVGVAILLNFLLMDKNTVAKDMSDDLADVSGLLADDGAAEASTDDYFANVVLNRQSARDEAMEVLKSVTGSESALEDVKTNAYNDIEKIAKDIEREANIETLIHSKGFEQCIAVVNGDSASVIVKTDGLTPGEVAQISEIVYTEAGIVPSSLKIIEKN